VLPHVAHDGKGRLSAFSLQCICKEGRVSFGFEYWQTKGGWSVISQTVVDY
jgi:hypothetical protein